MEVFVTDVEHLCRHHDVSVQEIIQGKTEVCSKFLIIMSIVFNHKTRIVH